MANGYDPVGFSLTHGKGSGRSSGPQPPRTVSQGEWGQPGYQMPQRRWQQLSGAIDVPSGRLEQPPSYEEAMGGEDMAAVTTAIIAGGSVLANMWGQHKGRQSAEEQFTKAESRAEDELAYNMLQNYQAWQQAAPRMQGSDQAYASTMANLGIPGLPQYNVPGVDPSAYAPPPRTPAELRGMGQPGGGRATDTGYISDVDYATGQATPRGQQEQVNVFEEEEFTRPSPRRGTMGGLLPNANV